MGLAGAGLASAIVAAGLAVGFAAFAVLNDEMRGFACSGAAGGSTSGTCVRFSASGSLSAFRALARLGLSGFHRDHQPVRGGSAGGPCNHPADGGRSLRLDPWTVAGGNRARWLCRRSCRRAGDGGVRLDSVVIGTAFGLGIFIVLAGTAYKLPWLFLKHGEAGSYDVASAAAGLLFLLGALNLAVGPASSATAILRGFKDTRVPMVLRLTAKWIIGMPVAYFRGLSPGLERRWCVGGTRRRRGRDGDPDQHTIVASRHGAVARVVMIRNMREQKSQ